MRRLLIPLCFLVANAFANVDKAWLEQAEKNIDKNAVHWLRDGLKDELAKKQKVEKTSSLPTGKCMTNAMPSISSPKLLVFISFSVPESTWFTLSKDIAKVDGIFVLRGLPNNSFHELAKRLIYFRQNGLTTQIQINPKLFEEYGIKTVPTFVIPGEGAYDKVSGNISTLFALDLFANEGEIRKGASELKEQLLERKRG